MPQPKLAIELIGIWTVTIKLTPQASELGMIVQYFITCSPAMPGKEIVTKRTEETLVKLNGLHENTTYHIKAKARYRGGKYGLDSESDRFTTNPGRCCFKHASYVNLIMVLMDHDHCKLCGRHSFRYSNFYLCLCTVGHRPNYGTPLFLLYAECIHGKIPRGPAIPFVFSRKLAILW